MSEYPEYVRGVKEGTGATVTPLKHVQMYKAHFTQRNIKRGIAYLKNRGRSDPPVFMEVDSRLLEGRRRKHRNPRGDSSRKSR